MATVGIAVGAGGNAARLEALSKEVAAIGGLFCFRREMMVASARGGIGKSCRGLRPWLRIHIDF
jgi:hypothetical protein